jgi:Cytidylyltransferase-like
MQQFKHALAILAMPYTSLDKIINERILETIMTNCKNAEKLSIVLRCQNDHYAPPTVAALRKYVGEIYSQLWDTYMSSTNFADENAVDPYHLPDVVVYPQNLPNTAPESWIDIQSDLDVVCTFNALCGWISEEATGRGALFQYRNQDGRGGLDEHVAALNAERASRNLAPVVALHVQEDHRYDDDTCPLFAEDGGNEQARYVTFLDDEEPTSSSSFSSSSLIQQSSSSSSSSSSRDHVAIDEKNGFDNGMLLSGPRLSTNDSASNDRLYDCVAVGGTFDGLHFGHRKLLTLAISSLHPLTGKLTIGITQDAMLQKKKYAAYIPTLQQRMQGVRNFLHRLAPGILKYVVLCIIFLACTVLFVVTMNDERFFAIISLTSESFFSILA